MTGRPRILVLGGSGLVGSAVVAEAARRGFDVVCASRTSDHFIDLADLSSIDAALSTIDADIVVNAAYVKTGPQADMVTAVAPGLVARRCADAGVRFVHVSTDVVFSSSPNWRHESDPTDPVGAYGELKLRAEHAVLEADGGAAVVRTSLVIGSSQRPGEQEALLRHAVANPGDVVFYRDELRAPVTATDLARALVDVASSGVAGVWHVAGPQALSRLQIAKRVAARLGVEAPLVGGTTPPGADRAKQVLISSLRFERAFGWSPDVI